MTTLAGRFCSSRARFAASARPGRSAVPARSRRRRRRDRQALESRGRGLVGAGGAEAVEAVGGHDHALGDRRGSFGRSRRSGACRPRRCSSLEALRFPRDAARRATRSLSASSSPARARARPRARARASAGWSMRELAEAAARVAGARGIRERRAELRAGVEQRHVQVGIELARAARMWPRPARRASLVRPPTHAASAAQPLIQSLLPYDSPSHD